MAAEPISPEEDANSAEYESRVETVLVGRFLKSVNKLIKAIAKAEATSQEDKLQDAIVALIQALKPVVDSEKLSALIIEGIQLGIQQSGLDEGSNIPSITHDVIEELITSAEDYEPVLAASIEDVAKQLAQSEMDQNFVTDAIAKVKSLENKAKRLASTVAGNAQAEGVIRAALANNLKLLWVNELNACLHCLAYAGRVIDPATDFGDHSFSINAPDFKDLKLEHPQGIILGPPLHPNCRCRLRVWDGPEPRKPEDIPRSNNNTTFAEALQREARRAVLRGASNYDSLPERIEAAEKLLNLGANLPVSVEKRAKRAIDTGAFKR